MNFTDLLAKMKQIDEGDVEAPSDAGGIPRTSRVAMRLLHAGHDHDGRRYATPNSQTR